MQVVYAILSQAAEAARADALRFMIIVFVVAAVAAVLLTPRRRNPPEGYYTAWLETRADNLETCVRWYAENTDDGAEARRLLAELEKKP